MSFQNRRSINRRKVPLIRELCEDLGFHQGAGANKTKNPMTESTHIWRRSYVTLKGTPGKDLIDWPNCYDDLFEMTRAYLESGHGEIHWPANGCASPRTVPEYPKDLNEIVEGLVNLFWLQNRIEANNRKRYSQNPLKEDSDFDNRVSADPEPKTPNTTSPVQKHETPNQWAAVNEGVPANYEQSWNDIIHHRPGPLADSKTSSESEEDDSEDSDSSEVYWPRPTNRSKDFSAVPDDDDRELSRNKSSRFDSIRKPAPNTQESATLKGTRKRGDVVSPPIKRRRFETQGSEDDNPDQEDRHHEPRRASKRRNVAPARANVSSNEIESSRHNLRSTDFEVDDKDDGSRIVNSAERPTPGSPRTSPTIMRAPESAESHEKDVSLSARSSVDTAPVSNPAVPQFPMQRSEFPPITLDRKANTVEGRFVSDQGAPVNARVAQPRIRFMIITHAPRAETYWRNGTFKDRSLEDIFAGVSGCIRRENIPRIVFKLKTKLQGLSTYPIDKDDHAGFEDMKERFINNMTEDVNDMTEDAKRGSISFEIKLELEPDRVEDVAQEAAEKFRCDFRGFF